MKFGLFIYFVMECIFGMVFYDDCFVNYMRNVICLGDDEYFEKVVNMVF